MEVKVSKGKDVVVVRNGKTAVLVMKKTQLRLVKTET